MQKRVGINTKGLVRGRTLKLMKIHWRWWKCEHEYDGKRENGWVKNWTLNVEIILFEKEIIQLVGVEQEKKWVLTFPLVPTISTVISSDPMSTTLPSLYPSAGSGAHTLPFPPSITPGVKDPKFHQLRPLTQWSSEKWILFKCPNARDKITGQIAV